MAHCWVSFFLFLRFSLDLPPILSRSPPHALPSLRPTLVGRIFLPILTPLEGIPSHPLSLKIRLKKHSSVLPLLWATNKTKNKQKQGRLFCLDPVPSSAQASRLRRWVPLISHKRLVPGMSPPQLDSPAQHCSGCW